MGPHGLLIGATGSGKSELLRTLVLALAVTHSPSTLNFALVDFKGGATFAQMDALPHTSAVITNLADELPLVDRMADALNGELVRRQELLTGGRQLLLARATTRRPARPARRCPRCRPCWSSATSSASCCRRSRTSSRCSSRSAGSAAPSACTCCWPASAWRRAGCAAWTPTCRTGSALRTFSGRTAASVLGVPDAFALPTAPGHGFFQYGTEPLIRFRSAYVSGSHRRPGRRRSSRPPADAVELLDVHHRLPRAAGARPGRSAGARTRRSATACWTSWSSGSTGRGTPAHQVWLPPLDDPPTFGELLGRCRRSGTRSARRRAAAARRSGIVDRPLEQRRDPLRLDLSAGAGHVLSSAARAAARARRCRRSRRPGADAHAGARCSSTAWTSAAARSTAMRDLPHVGGVAARQNTGAVRRTVAEIAALLARARADVRRARGGRHRRLPRGPRAAVSSAGDPYGDVFLVVDGWGTLRNEFEDIETKSPTSPPGACPTACTW